ncbi:phage portal protein [Halalkalibacterium halodurans]|uniref:phage portal protein n=1 Tax=Halalkalibacterium halodurans TaxID=86665 RepID=UPI002E1D37B7|nr:phage portal protein [Halalkalibacterium halodurans]
MIFRNALAPKASDTTDLNNPAPWFLKMFGNESSSGERVTVNSALGVPAVYACVNILANGIATLPFQTFKRTKTGRERDKKHAVAKLLEQRPNPYQGPFKFKHLIETHRNLWGNAYVNIEWGADGRPKGLWLLNPASTEPVVNVENNEVWYHTVLPNGDNVKIWHGDIIHLTALSTDGIKGKPPIQVIRESIGSAQAAQKFKGKFYRNGASTRGFLKIPGMLNPEAKEVVRREWEKANTGINNAQRVAILDAGLDYQSISMPLKDAQFVEGMNFDKKEIATFFNIPMHMVNELDRATHTNIEQQAIDFIRNTLSPIYTQYQEEFSYQLFSLREQERYYLKFNLEALLRADKKTQAEFYKIMLGEGVYSINEVRDLEDRDAIEGGDKHRVDLNHVSLDIADDYQLARAGLKGGEGNGEE